MDEQRNNMNILSSSALKLLACAFMLLDHIGVRLFPQVLALRLLGRLAFPLFAFFIGEGCRYTSNRLRHFLSVFLLGVLCESVYIIYMGGWYGNILLTFSLSILLIYLMQWCRLQSGSLPYLLMAAALAACYALSCYVNFDYGFFGIILPLFAAYPGDRLVENTDIIPKPLKKEHKLLLFGIGIMLTSINSAMGWNQLYALLTLPLLAMYSGKPGKRTLKYFFYIFYPVHLLLIEATAMLIR